jgi:mannose-1-phosphate guanylyltransferase
MINTAIIIAGGLGTRLRPLTETTPKPLLPIQGKPIIEHTIKQLKKHGIQKIILSIGYKAEQIQEYFKDGSTFGLEISYSIEDQPLGTGGAIRKAVGNLNTPVFVIWGDNLMDINYEKLSEKHNLHQKLVTMVLTPRDDVQHFGVAKLEEEKIIYFVEKPTREEAPSNLINAGAFVIDPKAIVSLPEGKCSIERDCFEKLAPLGQITAFTHHGQWYPTDTLEKYNHANQNYKK